MKKEEIEANKIYSTTTYKTLKEVVEKLDKIKNNDLRQRDFILRLGVYITNHSGRILVTFGEDKKLNSCMVISRHLDKFGEYLWVDFAWIDAHYRHLGFLYEKAIMNVCKIGGIKRVQARMNKGYNAMEKIWGTKVIAKIVEREVK